MSSERHQREKAIFLAARERSAGERDAYLSTATEGDAGLRRAVEALLQFDGPDPAADGASGSGSPGSGARRLDPGHAQSVRGSPTVPIPPALLWESVRRLRIVAILLPLTLVVMWIVPVAVGGRLAREFQELPQWGPPGLAIASSLGMIWLTLVARSPKTVLDLGLLYQVVVAWGLAVSQYWGTFFGVPAAMLDFDVVGFSVVALWMLMYNILVPTRPARALPALLLSALAPAGTYLLSVQYGQAPVLGPGRVFYVFMFPHLAAVAFTYVAIRLVYRLGSEVGMARELGSYRLDRRIGEGGMGEVWAASHRLLARPAAIKVIRRELLGRDAAAIDAAIQRFEREARTTAMLRSAHTVELYDFGVADDGSLYYVMELLDGVDLEAMVRRHGPLDPARVAWLARQACLSLAEAHAHGLVHRDIKPANLFVCQQGLEYDILKVLDFGLVLPLQSEREAPSSEGFLGTPAFMAPEAARGQTAVDARADLYALGCVMYWMLTGRAVFDETGVPAMLRAHREQAPTPPSERNETVPGCFDDVVLRLLEKDPARRYASAAALAEVLNELPIAPWSRERAARWWEER